MFTDEIVSAWMDDSTQGMSLIAIHKKHGVKMWDVRREFLKRGFRAKAVLRAPLSESQCAWVAAVIDCEGMLTIHTPNNHVQIFSKVNMVGNEITERLHVLTGGSCFESKARPPHERKQYIWHLASNGLRWLLPQILPHLLVKRRHAEILIEVLANNWRGHRMNQITLDERIKELRALNTRGIQP